MRHTPTKRTLTSVVAAAALALTGVASEAFASSAASSGSASSGSASTAAASASVQPSCDQHVAPGHFTCFALRRTDVHEARMLAAQTAPDGYGPSDIRAAYSLPANGSTATVAVIDAYDDPDAESDLATYRAQYGLPACTTANGCFTKLNQNGQTSPLPPTDTIGWAGEISLDLDMVSAACGSCHIALIEADDQSDNLFTAVKAAASLGYKYVSMSWGGSETGSESTYDSTYFQATGVVYTASSGDHDYAAGVSYPSTSPRVVSVGGTSLTRATDAGNARGWSETAWNSGPDEGTGSGCSSDEAQPSWQSILPGTVCSRRADTDVSAVADPNTGVAVYDSLDAGGWAVYGGTSASAPIIASVYALAGAPATNDSPVSYPYSHPKDLNDVTTGNNGTCTATLLCTAAAGWDGPTGLGTPNGLSAFTPGDVVTVTNPGSQTGLVGTATSLQIKATTTVPSTALTYTATGLPPGLSIDAGTGLISGTPTTGGVSDVTVTATDAAGASGAAGFTWAVNSNGTGCSGQVLANPGFESGATGWTASAGVVGTDGAYAHTGTGYAWLDGYGTAHTSTLSQQVTIPAGCKATLSYYLWTTTYEKQSRPTDTLTLTVNGQKVQAFSNADNATGYAQRSVSLSSYTGTTVTITWTGVENSSLATSFFLDDTSLSLS